ncbi:hypothetical protein CEXT_605201 [Caerostris extrusa]|uniref:Uncharacterized protein n=1 Tax=Caerostris extrusa TaxID=172846 RepID=A0AAV4QDT4_CAEEX|nr:hypothetical protein CEXT_605201 [Caerostris extrusa]
MENNSIQFSETVAETMLKVDHHSGQTARSLDESHAITLIAPEKFRTSKTVGALTDIQAVLPYGGTESRGDFIAHAGGRNLWHERHEKSKKEIYAASIPSMTSLSKG